ncbi:MAG: TRAP transporter small permease [Burkholderiaceae bacterium]|jgi:TRAP-type C4-dicarboxylate transport system permease small subunit|nr:TRAP transporter small permease [Burkholderiaceae bacterium]
MTLQQLRRGYERALEWLVIALMVVLAAEVTAGVVFRYVGYALVWYDEVASILLAWLTFYGSALASVKRAHIGCPELIEQLSPPKRRVFDIVAQLLVIGFFALLLWVGVSILPVLATDHMVSLPQVPMSVVQSVIPISAALILVAEVMHLATLLRSLPARVGGAALSDGLH